MLKRRSICYSLGLIVLLVSAASYARPPKKRVKKHCPEVVHQLRSGNGIWVRNSERSYGTLKTVELLKKSVQSVRKRFAKTHDLPVADISYKYAGRMKPHRSHHDGRDIDAGYYFKDGKMRRWFPKVKTRRLDVERQWALFETMIETDEVEYIFVSYPIQRVLYRHAQKKGYSKRQLSKIFQWPRPWRRKAGIIRLEWGHDNHFHVRFKK